jgi:hypothetical protein
MRYPSPLLQRARAPCTARYRSQTEFCIEAFAAETRYVPAAARAVRESRDLSPELERSVRRMPASAAWCAWVEGGRGWFVEGRLSDSAPESTDRPTLYLLFRDHDAVPLVAGMWCRSAPAQWDLLRIFSRDSAVSEDH